MSTYNDQIAQQPQQVYQTQVPAQQPQAVYVQQPYYTAETTPTVQSSQTTVPVTNTTSLPTSFLGLDVSSSAFWKGALVGAGITLLVTNESVQKTVMKGMTKMMSATSSGIEELKEKYEDAKAEVDAEDAGI